MTLSFKTIFAELEEAVRQGVLGRYVVGGAIAAAHYVEATATQDIDVFAVARPGSASPLHPFKEAYEWFVERGARWHDEHLVIGGWPLHLLPSTGPLVDDGLANPVRADVEGQPVNLFSFEHLAAIALETNRSKDRVRLQQMWFDERFDRSRFIGLVERFGLGDRWTRLQALMEDAQ